MGKTSSPPTAKAIPVNLITGLLGSGKTTCLKNLLNQKPKHEKWGILINEFGEIGIDAASLSSFQTDTPILEVAGGCICCTAQFGLTQALNQLLEQPDLDRLLIEPTGLGHPAKIIDTLNQSPFIQPVLIENILCLLDPKQLTPLRWQKSAVMRDLVTLSDTLIINKTDLATPEDMAQAYLILDSLYPAKKSRVETQQGKIDLSCLSQPHETPHFVLLSGETQHQQTLKESIRPTQDEPNIQTSLPNVLDFHLQNGEQTQSIGWIFQPNIQFNRTQLTKQINQWSSLIRAKGLLRTGKEWQNINWVENRLTFEDIAWRKDSRLELIFNHQNLHVKIKDIENQLVNCLIVR